MNGLALPASGDRITLRGEGDVIGIFESGAGGRVGEIKVRLDDAGGAPAEIECLRVVPERRGRGLGSEACRLLLRTLAEGGRDRVRARAPLSEGLAVYFWMRRGFRPLFGPGGDAGVAFERELAGDGPS